MKSRRIIILIAVLSVILLSLVFYCYTAYRYREMVFVGDVRLFPLERFYFISRCNSTSIEIGEGWIRFTKNNDYDYNVTVPVEKTDAIISDLYRIYEKHKDHNQTSLSEFTMAAYFDGEMMFRCMTAIKGESFGYFDDLTRYLRRVQNNYLPHKELDEPTRMALKQSASNEYERDILRANQMIETKNKYDSVKRMAGATGDRLTVRSHDRIKADRSENAESR